MSLKQIVGDDDAARVAVSCHLEDGQHRGPLVESEPRPGIGDSPTGPWPCIQVDTLCASCGEVLVTVSYSPRAWEVAQERERQKAKKRKAA